MLIKGPAGLTENKDSKQVRALGKHISGGGALQAEGTAVQRPGDETITSVFKQGHQGAGLGEPGGEDQG